MSTQRDDQEIVERLQAKTIDGQLDWRPMYKQTRPTDLTDEGLEEFTQPSGYLLQDDVHGFGLISVRIEDPQNEIVGEPTLFFGGEEADVRLRDVGILLDAIQSHLDELRRGNRQSTSEEIKERVRQEVAPYEEELARKEAELRQAEQEKLKLLEAVNGLAGNDSDDGKDQTPLTVETFRETLVECIKSEGEGEIPDSFQMYFDEQSVSNSIEQVDAEEGAEG